MNSIALGRITEERKNWRKDHPAGFYARPSTKADNSTDMFNWETGIPGKEGYFASCFTSHHNPGTEWEGVVYKVNLSFSKDYPTKTCCHLKAGRICLSIINKDGWRPGITIKQILLGIQDLLTNPNPNSPANPEAGSLFTRKPAEYKKKIKQQAEKFVPDTYLQNRHHTNKRLQMSRLGNLFTGGSSDTNDALKYSAPKEPKAKSSTPKPSAPEIVAPKISAPPAAAPKASGPSKIMASATVRLYKVNSSTGGYEPVDGGSQLGCVIMGTGTTFQILIYNGQKIPQCQLPLTFAFDFTIRDLYMSFADAQNNYFSVLFDSEEVMMNVIRVITAVVVHMASHNECALETIKRPFPGAAVDAGEDNSAVLAVGMAAGIYLTAWEIGDVSDYPGDVVAGRPLKQVSASDDVIKIKLTGGEEVIAGLSSALVGHKKGDRILLGVSPKTFYKLTDGLIDVSRRQFPGSWLLLEVEVAKIKSDKEKKKDKKAEPAPAPAPTPASPPASSSHGDEHDEVAARMAKMSKASGGAPMLAVSGERRRNSHGSHGSHDIDESNYHDRQQQQQQPPQQNSSNRSDNQRNDNYHRNDNQRHDSFDDRGRSNQGYNSSNSNYDDRNRGSNSRYDERDRYDNRGGNDSFNNRGGYNDSRGGNYGDNRGGGGNNYNNNNNRRYEQPRNEYALTVVEGQEARSYYLDDDRNGGALQGRGATERVNEAPKATSSDFQQLNQSIMIVQQSMLQLHTKLDQVGANVSTSVTLQQQQMQNQQSVVPNAASTGMAGFGGLPQPGMAGMGFGAPMNPYQMNPMLQQQQMMMMQQQQQMQQMAGGYGMPSPLGGGGASTTVRLKSEELIQNLKFIVEEYEQVRKDGDRGNAAKNSEHQETISNLKAQIARLEERNESLQSRNEKLMTEKSALLEKQAEMIQSGSSSSSKLYSMQQEIEQLRREKSGAEQEVSRLRAEQYSSSKNNQQAEADRAQIMTLETRVMQLQNEVVDLKQQKQSLESYKYTAQDVQAKLDSANDTIRRLQSQLDDAQDRNRSLQRQVDEASSRAPVVDVHHPEVEAYVHAQLEEARRALNEEIAALQAKIGQLQSSLDDEHVEHSKTKREFTSSQGSSDAELQQLKEELDELRATAGSRGGDGKASVEELKGIMQDIYGKTCELFDEGGSYEFKEIVKKLRAALKAVTNERS